MSTPDPSSGKIVPIDLAGIVLSIALFVGLLWPTLPMYFKQMYYKVNRITLVTQRRLYLSLLLGLLFTVPTFLFVLHDVSSGKNVIKTFAKHWLPLAAYVFFPIFVAWIRPLAANPLDLCDVVLILGLIVPIVLQIIFDDVTILFDQSFTSHHLWIDFHALYLIAGSLSIFVYSVLRPLPDVGLGKEMRLPTFWDIFIAILGFGLLLAVLPLLVYTDSAFDRHTNLKPWWVLLNFLLIFLFVALPLELIFRGVIQNLFHARVEVIRDVRQYTSDSDTKAKIGNLLNRMFSRNLEKKSNFNTTTHQYRQTEDLLELSLQLGAPAQAQSPLQPGNDLNRYSSMERSNRRGGEGKESLLISPNDEAQVRGGYPNDECGQRVDFMPEPLFQNEGLGVSRGSNSSQFTSQTNSRPSPYDYNAIQLDNFNGVDPTATPKTVAPSLMSKGQKSMNSYHLSNKNGQALTNPQFDIKDTTSQMLGVGYVSKQDAQIAAMAARNDYINGFDFEENDMENRYDALDGYNNNNNTYGHNNRQSINSSPNSNSDSRSDSSSYFSRSNNGQLLPKPKINDVEFDQQLFRSKQREGYGISTFEESPVWPTWQERHANFYRRSFFHWFLLPTKTDYFCLLLSALIYGGALTYNIGYFIQHAHETTVKFETYTWFTLFVVLTWQGFICGLLWRMTSQIWSSVLITAGFFTLGSYWLGIDG